MQSTACPVPGIRHPNPNFHLPVTDTVIPQSLCCRKWNITLIPVLGLIKELIKLHTFPKSCLESSPLHFSTSHQTSNHRMSDSSAAADDAPRIHPGITSNTQAGCRMAQAPIRSLNNLSNSVSEKRVCSKNKEITPSPKQKCWVTTCFPLNSCHCAQCPLAGALPDPFVGCSQD